MTSSKLFFDEESKPMNGQKREELKRVTEEEVQFPQGSQWGRCLQNDES